MTLNPFSSLQPPDSGSEHIVQAKPALDEAVEKAYRVYEGLDFCTSYNRSENEVNGLEKQIISPGQIDTLLQLIKSEAEPRKVNDFPTGLYISRLIQDSYDAGNNEFVLTTGYTLNRYVAFTAIPGLGTKINGKADRKLIILIDGDASDLCGENAKYSEITILGSTDNGCGYGAQHSKIRILGSTDEICGQDAKYCEIIVSGLVGHGPGKDAHNSIFVTSYKGSYKIFKEHVQKNCGNTIRLVDSSGKVIKEEHL